MANFENDFFFDPSKDSAEGQGNQGGNLTSDGLLETAAQQAGIDPDTLSPDDLQALKDQYGATMDTILGKWFDQHNRI